MIVYTTENILKPYNKAIQPVSIHEHRLNISYYSIEEYSNFDSYNEQWIALKIDRFEYLLVWNINQNWSDIFNDKYPLNLIRSVPT